MLDKSLVSGKAFRDDKNFPHGFSRSGNFSRNESDLLTRGGCCASSLVAGEIEPKGKAQKQLIAVCRGERDAETEFEKVWMKYSDFIGRKRCVFSFASSGNLASSEGRVYAKDLLS